MYKHIELYVNAYSEDLGAVGKNAVNTLFEKGQELKSNSCNGEKHIFSKIIDKKGLGYC